MKKIICTLALLAAISSASARDFGQLLDLIVAESPELKALELEHAAESEALTQENILSGPELEGNHKWGTRGENKYGVGISQNFDWPGLYKARSAARKANDNALLQLRLSSADDRRLEAKLQMIEFVTTGEQLRIVTDAAANMRRLLDLYQRGFEAGEESILDVNKLKIELLRVGRRETALREQRERQLESLLTMAGTGSIAADLKSLTQADLPADAIADEAEYERQIDSSHRMEYYRSMQQASRQSERVARLSGFPTFGIGYELEREDGQYFNGFSVNIGLPSWSNGHRKASARYQAMAQEVQMDAVRLAEILKMRRLRAAAFRAAGERDMFSEVLTSTNQPELLMKALKGGEISLMTYLQEFGWFLEASSDYVETVNNAAQLSAELNKYN